MTKQSELQKSRKVSFYIEKDFIDNKFEIKKIVSLPLSFKISRMYTNYYSEDLLNLLLEHRFNDLIQKNKEEFKALFQSLPFNQKITFNFNNRRIEIGESKNFEIIK
ncbi:MAG: hypothetical protein ACP6IY_17060 [Promethearchaeia archaeon]